MGKPTEPQVSVTDTADSKVLCAAAPSWSVHSKLGEISTGFEGLPTLCWEERRNTSAFCKPENDEDVLQPLDSRVTSRCASRGGVGTKRQRREPAYHVAP